MGGERNTLNATQVGVISRGTRLSFSFLEGIALLFGYLGHFVLSQLDRLVLNVEIVE